MHIQTSFYCSDRNINWLVWGIAGILREEAAFENMSECLAGFMKIFVACSVRKPRSQGSVCRFVSSSEGPAVSRSSMRACRNIGKTFSVAVDTAKPHTMCRLVSLCEH